MTNERGINVFIDNAQKNPKTLKKSTKIDDMKWEFYLSYLMFVFNTVIILYLIFPLIGSIMTLSMEVRVIIYVFASLIVSYILWMYLYSSLIKPRFIKKKEKPNINVRMFDILFNLTSGSDVIRGFLMILLVLFLIFFFSLYFPSWMLALLFYND